MDTQVLSKVDPEIGNILGKAVVITGGTTGIGRATAMLLASLGARVLILGRDEQALRTALDEIGKAGGEVHGLTADVSNEQGIQSIFQAADSQLGGVDILVANAGLAAESAVDMEYSQQKYIVETNLLGYMGCAHEAVQRMKKRGGGQIIFVGSMSADIHEKGSSVYVATKSGVQGFAAALRKEVSPDGIKVSLIEPGSVGTDMGDHPIDVQQKNESEGTMLMAEDIARCVLYCATQPKRVDVIKVMIRPSQQII